MNTWFQIVKFVMQLLILSNQRSKSTHISCNCVLRVTVFFFCSWPDLQQYSGLAVTQPLMGYLLSCHFHKQCGGQIELCISGGDHGGTPEVCLENGNSLASLIWKCSKISKCTCTRLVNLLDFERVAVAKFIGATAVRVPVVFNPGRRSKKDKSEGK